MASTTLRTITAAQARRTAIGAQGLAKSLPLDAPVATRAKLRRAIDTLALLQIDSVNVLARAHYLPLFARLGDYSIRGLQEEIWPSAAAPRTLMETWAHEASIVPLDTYRLLKWRQDEYVNGRWATSLRERNPQLIDRVLALITERGPISAGVIAAELGHAKKTGKWWGWSDTKVACEVLFAGGSIGTAFRRGFERHYDLTERLVPTDANPPLPVAEAKKQLVALSAKSHGIGTLADLADYFRLSVTDTKKAVLELTRDGVLEPVQVQGWKEPAYLHAEAKVPRSVSGAALLCPFDPLIWFRRRTERLFDFHFRIEIYTPLPKRIFGYYVFPLLVGDALVGRFDLKADRGTATLLVQASWLEPGADRSRVVPAALIELRRMAKWLGMDHSRINPAGDLAAELFRAAATDEGFPLAE